MPRHPGNKHKKTPTKRKTKLLGLVLGIFLGFSVQANPVELEQVIGAIDSVNNTVSFCIQTSEMSGNNTIAELSCITLPMNIANELSVNCLGINNWTTMTTELVCGDDLLGL